MTDLPEKWKWQTVSSADTLPKATWLVARVEALLSIYYRPELSEEADLLATMTWIDVLKDVPQSALEQAFGEWERNEERRPTPAGIRKRALARVQQHEAPQDDDRPFAPVVVPEKELARRRASQSVYQAAFPSLRRVTGLEDDAS